MEDFHEDITFDDPCHGMRPGFRLSNWPDGTWEVSDGLIWQRRDRLAEHRQRQEYIREHYGGGHSWIKIPRAPWPALVTGGTDWCDYTVQAIVRVVAGGRAGVAVRWQDGRHCYYALLENLRNVVFYRRQQDELVELARKPFSHSAEAFYKLTVAARGDSFTCAVAGGPTLEVTDSQSPTGGVALVAECPAAYRRLEISGVRRPATIRQLPAGIVPRKQLTVPIPPYDPETALRPALRQLHGEPLIVLRPNHGRELVLVGPDGLELLRLDPWDDIPGDVGDLPFQVFDLDGDGRDEVVLIAGGRLRVYSTATGEQLAERALPEANPYGECVTDPQWAAVNDALCPVRLDGRGRMGFYIKDRYWNIHLYDSSLRPLWHKAVNTGHFPWPVDVDGDGREEILCGHTLFDVEGNVIWKADLSDHADAIAFLSLTGDAPPQFYLMAGEEGVVSLDAASGEILSQYRLGHAQACLIGQFLEGPSRQLLVDTLWGEPNIHYLLDDQLRELARWELQFPDKSPPPYALPWGERDLVAVGDGILDPLTGEHFADTEPWSGQRNLLGQFVIDWPGAGPSRLVQLLDDRVVVCGPQEAPVRRASPLPKAFSGYQPR